MSESIIAFFGAHTQVFLTVHLIGVALGMGGATITDIVFFNFLRDYQISKKEAEVMRVLSNIIMVALGILFLSGAALFLSHPAHYASSPAFLAKAMIVLVITINGVFMHKFIAPHMIRFSFRHPVQSTHALHTMRAVAFGMGAVSFTSWYVVFFIAMLKSYLPKEVNTVQIITAYLLILSFAVLTSQILQNHMKNKAS